MSFILKFLGITNSVSNTEERFWTSLNPPASSGVRVNADTALAISTVWACVGLISETIAALPLVMFRRLADGGKERATDHPLYTLLHDQPNHWQTSFEFRQMLMGHALLRGNGYAQIVPGPRGPVDQLIPLHPDRVTVEKSELGLRYRVLQDDGPPDLLLDDEIFHLRGLTLDGVTGVSVIEYARESIGLALAAERYGGKFFGNDSRPGGVLKTDRALKPEAAQRLKASWEAAHAGSNNHRVAILEEGLEWQQIGIAPEDAQFLQTREFQAEDIARWFRVTPHMIGLTSKATSWGSGIEQMSIGFVTYTLMAWLTRWQQTIRRDLIIAPDTYFAEFVIEALLRGDTVSRYNAYAIGRQWGWLSVNDIRRLENMNPVDNGDVYLQPLNMVEAGAPPPTPAPPARASHYRLLVQEAASRIIRKEIAAMSRAAKRYIEDESGWLRAMHDFYMEHVSFVAEVLHISRPAAGQYVNQQQIELIRGGIEAMEDWETRRVADLVALALEEHSEG